MNKLAILTAFLAGYFVNDMVSEFVPVAYAEVDGMDYRDLRRDRDFKKAVEYIVEDITEDPEDCSIYGSISGDGYGQIQGSQVYVYELNGQPELYISC